MLFTAPELAEDDLAIYMQIEDLRKSLAFATQARRWEGFLRKVMFARGIQGSNSIEGFNVTVQDAIAAVEGESPLQASADTWMAILGYRDAMTYVLQLSDDPDFSYSVELIRSLHFMMIKHALGKHPGRWRPGPIFVRNDATGERVYEGPDRILVPSLMDELVAALRENGKTPVLVRAAMAHLNFVMIHPFSDGNGRMGRCLQTLVLAREGILARDFCSIEEYLGANTQAYYDVLALVGAGSWNPDRDSLPWVRFCLRAHKQQAETLLRRTRELEILWSAIERDIERAGLPERMVTPLADAVLGFRVTNQRYRREHDISMNQASRDFQHLVAAKYLKPKGKSLRERFYVPESKLQRIAENVRRGIAPEPFQVDRPKQQSLWDLV